MNTGLNFYKTTDEGEAVRAIPQMRISSMDELTPTFNFVVTLNEFTFGFQSVSGLSVSNKVNYIAEGGVNDHQIMVGCPSDDNPTLTFKRGMLIRRPTIISNAARAAAARIPNNIARKSALIAVNMLDPQASLEMGPALGIIKVYSRRHTLRAIYSFLSLGMTSWRADDLDATTTSIFCEEFTVAHTGLVRHPLSAVPQVVDAVKSAVSDVKTSNNAKFVYDKAEESKKRRDEIEELKKKKQEEVNLMAEKKRKERELREEQKRLDELNRQLKDQENSDT